MIAQPKFQFFSSVITKRAEYLKIRVRDAQAKLGNQAYSKTAERLLFSRFGEKINFGIKTTELVHAQR